MSNKCQCCLKNEASWAWQPFGPDQVRTYTLLGSHYRGFPVIRVCQSCKKAEIVHFMYLGVRYLVTDWRLRTVSEEEATR